jgi:hypothetical protein
MQRTVSAFNFLLAAFICITLFSCSKSSSSSSGGGGGTTPPGSVLFPLAMNDQWNYRLKDYDTATGLVTDSVDFTLTVTGQTTANGVTYYSLQNSLGNGTLWLANLSSTTVGSIDSVNGINYYTLFASGTGDSLQSISSWPVNVSGTCVGTEKLYAYYADTTLINLDGTVYTNSIKNDAVIYDCSSNKTEAQVFFVKQGVGLVRYSQYVYNSAGNHLLQLAWVLESETLH